MPPTMDPRVRLLIRAFGALIFVGLVLMLGMFSFADLQDYFSMETIEKTLLSWGPFGIIASIALMTMHTFIPFPAEFLALANGMIYGKIWGTVITWVGAMLGAAIAFGLTRRLGRPFVERWVDRSRHRVIDQLLNADSTYVVFVSRFIPVISFNLVNFVAGLLHITWLRFLLATGIGILPMTILMVAIGDSLDNLTWGMSSLIGAAVIVLIVIIRLLKSNLEDREKSLNAPTIDLEKRHKPTKRDDK